MLASLRQQRRLVLVVAGIVAVIGIGSAYAVAANTTRERSRPLEARHPFPTSSSLASSSTTVSTSTSTSTTTVAPAVLNVPRVQRPNTSKPGPRDSCPTGAPVAAVSSVNTSERQPAPPNATLYDTSVNGTLTNNGTSAVVVYAPLVLLSDVAYGDVVTEFVGSKLSTIIAPGASAAWQAVDVQTIDRPSGATVSVTRWSWASAAFVHCPTG